MALRTHHRRAGMTLVELLVVVAIIGLLAVTVLPNVASTTESRRSREAARIASTFVAKAQSRAIGRPEWAGVSIVPANANARYGIDLFQANVPQVYRGETFSTRAYLETWAPLSRRLMLYDTQTAQVLPYPDRNIVSGDLIRFDGSGPWYEINTPANAVPHVWYCVLRGSLGGPAGASELTTQTSRNTPWPTQSLDPSRPQDVTHTFEILRQPVRNGTAFTIPDGRCIDLTWSGYGPMSDYRTFVGEDVNRNRVLDANEDTNGNGKLDLNQGAPTSILFDSTGRVRQLLLGTARITVTGPIYLLVGRVDRATNDPSFPSDYDGTDDTKGFNWQYGDSFWIGIDPASGIAKTAECLPGTANVVASQKLIRSEMPAGGR